MKAHPLTELDVQLKALRLPDAVPEYRFTESRRWRFDRAWPAFMVALEYEGGVWTKGRHTRPAGFIQDCHKYNTAALMGWKVLRVTGEHVKSGQAVEWLEKALTDER